MKRACALARDQTTLREPTTIPTPSAWAAEPDSFGKNAKHAINRLRQSRETGNAPA
jgi:hypothetical protein